MIPWYVLWSVFHEDSESGLRIADFLRKRVEIAIFRFLDLPEFGWDFRRGRIHVPRPSGAPRGGDLFGNSEYFVLSLERSLTPPPCQSS